MTDISLEAVLKRVDEHLTQKESVASNVLYDVIDSVKQARADLVRLEKALENFQHSIELKHKDIEYSVKNNKEKVEKHDKIIAWVVTLFMGAILTAIIATVLI